jgi:hypothetical protein
LEEEASRISLVRIQGSESSMENCTLLVKSKKYSRNLLSVKKSKKSTKSKKSKKSKTKKIQKNPKIENTTEIKKGEEKVLPQRTQIGNDVHGAPQIQQVHPPVHFFVHHFQTFHVLAV